VFADRYHVEYLRNPKMVRNAIAYVIRGSTTIPPDTNETPSYFAVSPPTMPLLRAAMSRAQSCARGSPPLARLASIRSAMWET
jgi:hypothetical protein